MKKRIVLVLVAILCVLSIGIYSPSVIKAAEVDTKNIQVTGEVEDQETYQASMEEYLSAWNDFDFAGYLEESGDELEDELKDLYQKWANLKENLGECQSISQENFEEKDGSISAYMVVSYENKMLKFSFTFEDGQSIDEQVEEYVEVKEPLSKRMTTAGINTVMSILIVFVVLLFIAFIISLLKFVPMLFQKKQPEAVPVAEAVSEPAVSEEVVEDDTELVAVITAAIMASMGDEAPADGLVVRSIKRRQGNHWKK